MAAYFATGDKTTILYVGDTYYENYHSVTNVTCTDKELEVAFDITARDVKHRNFLVFTFVGHDAQLIAANWR